MCLFFEKFISNFPSDALCCGSYASLAYLKNHRWCRRRAKERMERSFTFRLNNMKASQLKRQVK
jgi:hypothetical protein